MSDNSRYALLVIQNAPHPPELFEQQKQAVKALDGATFTNKRWIIEFDPDNPPLDTLNRLYAIAAEYGTKVKIVAERDRPTEEDQD